MSKQPNFRFGVAITIAAAITTLSIASAAPASASGGKLPKQFVTKLAGAAEVDVQGDPDGIGIARINVKQESGKPARVCLTVDAFKIAKVVKVHIHNAAANANGPVVVDYPVTDELVRVNGRGVITRIKGCMDVADDLATAIRSNSGAYYVNIHTDEFPKGAIRGQLPVWAAAKPAPAANSDAGNSTGHNHSEAPASDKPDTGHTY
jgi:hypothetical protein